MTLFSSAAVAAIPQRYLTAYSKVDSSVQWQLNQSYHSAVAFKLYDANPDSSVMALFGCLRFKHYLSLSETRVSIQFNAVAYQWFQKDDNNNTL